MDKKYLFPIAGAIIIIIAIIGGFYVYQSYKVSTVQTLLKESEQHTDIAQHDLSSNNKLPNSTQIQNALVEINNSIILDEAASKYADQPYKDFITYDLMRLQTDMKLGELYLQYLQYMKSGNYGSVLSLTDEEKQYTNTIQTYKDKENELIDANLGNLGFLNN